MNNDNVKIAVLYHDDADGFGAAFACHEFFNENSVEAIYIPVQYNQPIPEIPKTIEFLYIVDFSYNREITMSLSERFGKDRIKIIDHHKTAEKELNGLSYAHFTNEYSGAVFTWKIMFPLRQIPEILEYVQDRDLWKFKLPYSKEVNSYIATLPYNFKIWKEFDFTTAVNGGQSIIAFQKQQIARAIKNVRIESIDEYTVPVINISDNISEIGNELCKLYPTYPFSVSYVDSINSIRCYSLRSIGEFDVSNIAKKFGGGGHKNAAGFTTTIPRHNLTEFYTGNTI